MSDRGLRMDLGPGRRRLRWRAVLGGHLKPRAQAKGNARRSWPFGGAFGGGLGPRPCLARSLAIASGMARASSHCMTPPQRGTRRDVDVKDVTEQPGPGSSSRLGCEDRVGASDGLVLLEERELHGRRLDLGPRLRPALWRASSVRRGSAPCGNLGGGMSAQTRASRSSGSSTRATVPSRQIFFREYRVKPSSRSTPVRISYSQPLRKKRSRRAARGHVARLSPCAGKNRRQQASFRGDFRGLRSRRSRRSTFVPSDAPTAAGC